MILYRKNVLIVTGIMAIIKIAVFMMYVFVVETRINVIRNLKICLRKIKLYVLKTVGSDFYGRNKIGV